MHMQKVIENKPFYKATVKVPCSCGGTMCGTGWLATGEVLASGYKPESNEILSFEFIQCDKCGEWQAS